MKQHKSVNPKNRSTIIVYQTKNGVLEDVMLDLYLTVVVALEDLGEREIWAIPVESEPKVRVELGFASFANELRLGYQNENRKHRKKSWEIEVTFEQGLQNVFVEVDKVKVQAAEVDKREEFFGSLQNSTS